MVWQTYLSIKSFQTKPDQAQKSATNDLLKKKKLHTQKEETPTHHPIVQQSFCFHSVSVPFLSFCFTSHPISNGHDDHPISDILFTLLQVGPSGPHQGGEILRGWISRVISARWMEFLVRSKESSP